MQQLDEATVEEQTSDYELPSIELLQEPDPDPSDLTALDAAWEDEPVTFGPGASSCKDGIIARIRAARRPASSPNT